MPKIYTPHNVRLSDTHTDAQYEVGTRARGADGSEFLYVKAGSAITQYYWVAIDSTFAAAAHLTKSNARQANAIGVANSAAIAASSHGWVQVLGLTTAALAALSADNAALYTSAVDGVLDDAASGSGTTFEKIEGAIGDASQPNNQTSGAVMLTDYPHAVP